MPPPTKRAAVTAAMSVAEDIAEGRLDPAELAHRAAHELRALVGTVVGPDDPVWPLQCDITRAVLAAGGIPADELAEWLAVARHRAGEPVEPAVDAVAASEPVSLPVTPPEPESSASGAASAGYGDPPAPDAPDAPVVTSLHPGRDEYDPLAGWSPGGPRVR